MLMCQNCGQYFCYPSCPSFVGLSAELGRRLFRCFSCGESIFEADDYSIYNGVAFCAECAERREEKEGDK